MFASACTKRCRKINHQFALSYARTQYLHCVMCLPVFFIQMYSFSLHTGRWPIPSHDLTSLQRRREEVEKEVRFNHVIQHVIMTCCRYAVFNEDGTLAELKACLFVCVCVCTAYQTHM